MGTGEAFLDRESTQADEAIQRSQAGWSFWIASPPSEARNDICIGHLNEYFLPRAWYEMLNRRATLEMWVTGTTHGLRLVPLNA